MKTKLLLLITAFFLQFANAQMDDKFYFPNKIINPISLPHEEFSLKVEQDSITGIFFKKENPNATLVFLHGAGGNVTYFQKMATPFLNANYQVIMVDFRGYGKSSGTPTHLNVAKDGQQFFDYLKNRKEIKNTKIILYGQSLGTQIATHLAKENSKDISMLILDGAFTSFTDLACSYKPEAKDVIKKYLVSPYSAIEDIKLVSVPKILIHSKEDKDIPYALGKELLEAATEPKYFLEYSGAHINALIINPDLIINKVNELLK